MKSDIPKSRADIEEAIATNKRSLENLECSDSKTVSELRLVIGGALGALEWVLKSWPADRKKVIAMKRKKKEEK